ncbi:hypothetical protein ACP4OV_023223 [Aristida adscensionis]
MVMYQENKSVKINLEMAKRDLTEAEKKTAATALAIDKLKQLLAVYECWIGVTILVPEILEAETLLVVAVSLGEAATLLGVVASLGIAIEIVVVVVCCCNSS